MKDPPLKKSPEAMALRACADLWVEISIDGGRRKELEEADNDMLRAALRYTRAVDKAKEAEPKIVLRWRCRLCQRDKFTKKCPHTCVGGFRKHHLKWEPIYAEETEDQVPGSAQAGG